MEDPQQLKERLFERAQDVDWEGDGEERLLNTFQGIVVGVRGSSLLWGGHSAGGHGGMEFLFLDIETRSACDLKKSGSYKYFEDPTTDLWVACYAFGDEAVQTWWPTEPCPPRIAAWVLSGGKISGWNVGGFERLAWNALLGPKYGWPIPALEQYDDTMAMAAAMALPRALGDAAAVFSAGVQKDKEGQSLMLRMSKPRRARKGEDPTGLYWWDERERLDRLAAYCRQDVEAERAVRARLLPLHPMERQIWLLDQRINDRGVRFDRELAHALLQIANQARDDLDRQMLEATGGFVTACSQVTALTEWLKSQGVPVTTLAKAAIDDLLADDLPARPKRAVQLRQLAAKASVAKLKAGFECAGSDGRMRGLLAYHGAATGRWAGRLFQPQNMPRGTDTIKDPDTATPYLLQSDAKLVDFLYGAPMAAVSDCLRATLCATDGHDLLAADFSAIEGRVTAWLAGEEDELDAYRAADAGTGPGIYEITAAGIFDIGVKAVTKAERQVGKVACLALGYGGGVNAFRSMAKGYGLRMDPAFEPLWGNADGDTREAAVLRYEQAVERQDTSATALTREGWLASELTKVAWRATHPHIVQLWRDLEDAATQAIEDPGSIQIVRAVRYRVAKGFLWCQLPSGRCLAYGSPQIEMRETPWGSQKKSVTALGVNSVTKKWERFALYGGLACENIVQAIARDLMAHAMLKSEAAGYPILLTVHDEIIAEPPEGFGSVADFERLICDLPAWAKGLPLTASGWRGKRYRKD